MFINVTVFIIVPLIILILFFLGLKSINNFFVNIIVRLFENGKQIKGVTKIGNFLRLICSNKNLFRSLIILVKLPFWIFYISCIGVSIWVFVAFFKIDYTIDSLNKTNEYVKLIELQDKFINIKYLDENLEIFRIQLNTNNVLFEQPFEPMKYYRDSYDFYNEDRNKLTSLCRDFNGFNTRIPFSYFEKYVIDKYKTESKSWQTIMMLRGIIAHLANRVDKVYLFVKGYSDTTPNEDWRLYLSKGEMYNVIEYYEASNSLYTTYEINPQMKKMVNLPLDKNLPKNMYSNADLPLLRAKFVQEKYINEFLKECTNIEFESGILEGQVLNKSIEQMRNVEVFIAVKRNLFNKLVD